MTANYWAFTLTILMAIAIYGTLSHFIFKGLLSVFIDITNLKYSYKQLDTLVYSLVISSAFYLIILIAIKQTDYLKKDFKKLSIQSLFAFLITEIFIFFIVKFL